MNKAHLSVKLGPKKYKTVILPMVVSIASKYYKVSDTSVEYEDMVSEGMLGLAKAIRHFKTKFNMQFSTYAYTRIDGAVRDILRREKVKLRNITFVDSDKLARMSASIRDSSLTVEDRVALKQMAELVYETAARELPDDQFQVLFMHYKVQLPVSRIAELMNCSTGYVSKTKVAALNNLRLALHKKGMRDVIYR